MSAGIEIGVHDLHDLLATGVVDQLVDIREAWELERAALRGAVHIPMNELPDRVGELDPSRPVYLLCHHGQRSLQAAMWLRQQGFDRAISIAGGIDAWAQTFDSNMARY